MAARRLVDEVLDRPLASGGHRRTRGVAAAAIAAAVIGAVLVWGAAAGATPTDEPVEPEPTPSVGDVTMCQGDEGPAESKVGLAGVKLLEGVAGATSSAGTGSVSEDGTTLAVSINAGFTATGIVVRGGTTFNVYTGPFVGPINVIDMPPPSTPDVLVPAISHWFVCGGQTVTTTTTTTSPGTTTGTTTAGTDTTTTTTAPAATASTTTTTGTTTTTAPILPVTSGTPTGLIAAGVALIAGGGMALFLMRRRRAAAGE